MKKLAIPTVIIGAVLALFLQSDPARAQATRTWVSGTGSDSNPCSRTAPCKTFAAAYAQTLAGGEISVIDSGAYGAVTIGHALTINGEGSLASVLVSSGTAFTISPGASDQVIFRNLSVTGAGGGTVGFNITSGTVTIDKCFIYGFTAGFVGGTAILVAPSGSATVAIRDTDITNSSFGVIASTSSGFAVVGVDNVRFNSLPGDGVAALSANAFIEVSHASFRNLGTAVLASGGTVSVENSELTNNTTAFNAASSGSVIRINGNSIYDNTTGFSLVAGATIASGNNNKTASNGGAGAPNGMLGNQ